MFVDETIWGKLIDKRNFPLSGKVLIEYNDSVIEGDGFLKDKFSDLKFNTRNVVDFIKATNNIENIDNNKFRITSYSNTKYFKFTFIPEKLIIVLNGKDEIVHNINFVSNKSMSNGNFNISFDVDDSNDCNCELIPLFDTNGKGLELIICDN